MQSLFEVKKVDRDFYEEKLRDFLPDKFVDIHTHIWLDSFRVGKEEVRRSVLWPSMVAKDNSIEDLNETYRLMFPGKTVTPLLFGQPNFEYDVNKGNQYVTESAQKFGYPALMLAYPGMSAD